MSHRFSRFNSGFAILAGTTVSAIAIATTQPAVAKSPKEVAQIAIATTVEVNNPINPEYSGSGVIIAKTGNIYTVLTANHVVKSKAGQYTIHTNKNKDYPAILTQKLQIAKTDPDLAIVTFQSQEEYPVAALSDSDQATIGSGLYVCGFPARTKTITEREFTMTGGAVISRRQNGDQGYTMVYDAVTRIGMSGGPVFDVNGRVLGIHGEGEGLTEVVNEATGQRENASKTGRNLGIPINTFMGLLSQAHITLPKLKVDNRPADNDEAKTPEGATK